MALLIECMLKCAPILIDNADIVREAMLGQLAWLLAAKQSTILVSCAAKEQPCGLPSSDFPIGLSAARAIPWRDREESTHRYYICRARISPSGERPAEDGHTYHPEIHDGMLITLSFLLSSFAVLLAL